ncbi:MAG: NADP-dependent oxidoreductase [Pseudomonadota bacterium]
MRAAVIERFGDVNEIRIVDLPTPAPAPGQVLLRVAYAGVNPADWKSREGMTANFYPIQFPHVLGFDAAGVVVACGKGVTGVSEGDRVFTAADHAAGTSGSYAEYMCVPADILAPVPQAMSLRTAAALPVAAITAWQAIMARDRGNVQSSDAVLIHGASGGVGSFAVQFARLQGAAVATSCSRKNLDYVTHLGSECALDYTRHNLADALKRWRPEGLDCIVDAVGGDTLTEPYALLRPGGTLVSIATLNADGDIASDTARAAALGRRKVFAFMDTAELASELVSIAQLIVAGRVQAPAITEYRLEDVQTAHRALATGHSCGKRVLRINDKLS